MLKLANPIYRRGDLIHAIKQGVHLVFKNPPKEDGEYAIVGPFPSTYHLRVEIQAGNIIRII